MALTPVEVRHIQLKRGLFDAAHCDVADSIAAEFAEINDSDDFFRAHRRAVRGARHLRQIDDDSRCLAIHDAHDLAHRGLPGNQQIVVRAGGAQSFLHAVGHHQHRGEHEHHKGDTDNGDRRRQTARDRTA